MPVSDTVIEWPAGRSSQRMFEAAAGHVSPVLKPVLTPLSSLYAGIMRVRNFGYDHKILPQHRVGVPVISIGNIVTGGAGKTPITRWLTEQLLARSRRPAILHGGYGDDEPRLHQEWHPEIIVIAGKNRVASARQAIERGADVILLDDAFQHRRLARDLDLVLLAAETQDIRLLPRGPGREPLPAVSRSSFVLVTRKTATPDAAVLLETRVHQVAPGIATGRVYLKLVTTLPTQPVVAVSSIARPDQLLGQLRAAGANVQRLLAYPDHYEYNQADAQHIVQRAGSHLLVTTAKDAVKLRALLPDVLLHVVEQEVVFESGLAELLTALENVL